MLQTPIVERGSLHSHRYSNFDAAKTTAAWMIGGDMKIEHRICYIANSKVKQVSLVLQIPRGTSVQRYLLWKKEAEEACPGSPGSLTSSTLDRGLADVVPRDRMQGHPRLSDAKKLICNC